MKSEEMHIAKKDSNEVKARHSRDQAYQFTDNRVGTQRNNEIKRSADERLAAHHNPLIQKKDKVINFGSGTSPETLMKPQNDHVEDIDVFNIDSGHMLLAELIQTYLVQRDVAALGSLLSELKQAYVSDKKVEGVTSEQLCQSAINGDLSWLKHGFFPKVEGFNGVIAAIQKMGESARVGFEMRAKQLGGMHAGLGDASHLPADGTSDMVYCINGYGYSPLTDPSVFVPMHRSLKGGGMLNIVSELMGPTVKDFLGFSRADRRQFESLFVLTRTENVITPNPDPAATFNLSNEQEVRHLISERELLATAFAKAGKAPKEVAALELFDYVPGMSFIYLSKTAALGFDPLTVDMESRHTEGGGELDENIHVNLMFRKK